ADDDRLDPELGGGLRRAQHRLLGRVVAPHAVDRYSHAKPTRAGNPEAGDASVAPTLRGTISDVEVAHALGVGLDELLARFHIRAHQLLEDVVDLGGVLDVYAQERAGVRVHGRVPELVCVHLTE